MPQQQSLQITELHPREISSKRCLLAFFALQPNPNIRFVDHTHIIPSISNTSDSFIRVFPYSLCNLSLLGWAASADTDYWGFAGDFKETLSCLVCAHESVQSSPVDHETGVVDLSFELFQGEIGFLDCSQVFHEEMLLGSVFEAG